MTLISISLTQGQVKDRIRLVTIEWTLGVIANKFKVRDMLSHAHPQESVKFNWAWTECSVWRQGRRFCPPTGHQSSPLICWPLGSNMPPPWLWRTPFQRWICRCQPGWAELSFPGGAQQSWSRCQAHRQRCHVQCLGGSRHTDSHISNLAVKFPEFHGFLRFSQSPETGNRETGKLTHGKNSSYLKSPN